MREPLWTGSRAGWSIYFRSNPYLWSCS